MTPLNFLTWLPGLSGSKGLCVDCGAGTTGTANILSPYFDRVVALDHRPVSGHTKANVTTQQGSANDLPFDENAVDLLISVQALHHFDRARHLSEAKRVLRPGGVFAALSWGEMEMPEAVERAYAPVLEAIAPYWEPERSDTIKGYPALAFDGLPIDRPAAVLKRTVSLNDFEATLATWSAVQNALQAGVDLPDPDEDLIECPEDSFEIRWRLLGQVFRA